MAQSYNVTGKVALVTGAARGIGFEAARQLHAKGASVAVVDLDRQDAADAAERIGERAMGLDADVTDMRAMELVVSEVVERFGGVDIVVANAGIAPTPRPMTVIGNEMFERVVEVDLMGVWRTVKPALPQIVERQGHVVVVASVYAFLNGVMAAPYAMAKAGVEQLGRALRAELKPHNASASVAYFGFIDTKMVQDAFADPIAMQIEEAYPKFITKRLQPSDAGAAIVRGIERRSPRIIAPRWWAAWSTMRGIVNPVFDRFTERDDRVQDAVRQGETIDSA